jgi:hypothetical protein
MTTYRVFGIGSGDSSQVLTQIPLSAEDALAEALKLEADGYETVGLVDLETGKRISLEEFKGMHDNE